MSFWRFGGFSASSLETLLASASPPLDGNGLPTLTLEQLLEEDDLLQECKTQNTRLIDYLGRVDVLKRLLGYVTGDIFEFNDDEESSSGKVSADEKGS